MIEARLIELETRVAYQDDALRELNEAVVRQQQEISRLERLCIGLQNRLIALADGGGGSPVVDEKPPHY
jgi:SlyX protein